MQASEERWSELAGGAEVEVGEMEREVLDFLDEDRVLQD
jgi:hypothetical protein